MQHYIESFLFHCIYEKNLSEKTLKAYKIDLQQFSRYNVKTCLQDIDKTFLRAYVKHLFTSQYKEKTIKRKLATSKAFFSYLESENHIIESPFRHLHLKIKEANLLPKTIRLNEIKKLLRYMYKYKASIDRNKSSYAYKTLVRDIVVIELLFSTGIRVAEVCSLKRSSLNLTDGSITVIGKGNKERTIHFGTQQIKNLIKEYLRLYEKDIAGREHLFINRLDNALSEQSVRFMIKRYTSKANISTHITPHMFRHSMATLLLEEGVDIRYIQNILGHASISTTQIYTKVNPRHQKKILLTKHPRRLFEDF
jgi:integrase/recombinase XerD